MSSKPELIPFVVGRSLPIAGATLIYLGPTLLSPATPWWLWIGALGTLGPFFYNLICWSSTRYRWTPTSLSVEQWGHRTTIDWRRVRGIEIDRDYSGGSVILTVEEDGPAPRLGKWVLRGVREAAAIARRFQLERAIEATARFGSTRTKRVG